MRPTCAGGWKAGRRRRRGGWQRRRGAVVAHTRPPPRARSHKGVLVEPVGMHAEGEEDERGDEGDAAEHRGDEPDLPHLPALRAVLGHDNVAGDGDHAAVVEDGDDDERDDGQRKGGRVLRPRVGAIDTGAAPRRQVAALVARRAAGGHTRAGEKHRVIVGRRRRIGVVDVLVHPGAVGVNAEDAEEEEEEELHGAGNLRASDGWVKEGGRGVAVARRLRARTHCGAARRPPPAAHARGR